MIRDVTPLLPVADLVEAARFVEACFGIQTIVLQEGQYAYCRGDAGAIRFVQAPAGTDMDDPARQVGVYVDVEDVDGLWDARKAAIQALPETHRQAPADTAHGQREFVVVHDQIMFVAGQPMGKETQA